MLKKNQVVFGTVWDIRNYGLMIGASDTWGLLHSTQCHLFKNAFYKSTEMTTGDVLPVVFDSITGEMKGVKFKSFQASKLDPLKVFKEQFGTLRVKGTIDSFNSESATVSIQSIGETELVNSLYAIFINTDYDRSGKPVDLTKILIENDECEVEITGYSEELRTLLCSRAKALPVIIENEVINEISKSKETVIVIGATGSGKSSVINAILDCMKTNNSYRAAVGNFNWVTKDIVPYHCSEMVLFDTPGVGENEKADEEHTASIKDWLSKNRDKSPIVLVVFDGHVRDYGSTFKLLKSIYSDSLRFIGIVNQIDVIFPIGLYENSRTTNAPKNIQDAVNRQIICKIESVARRIKDIIGKDIPTIAISSGATFNDKKIQPSNIENLTTVILTYKFLENIPLPTKYKIAPIPQEIPPFDEPASKINEKILNQAPEGSNLFHEDTRVVDKSDSIDQSMGNLNTSIQLFKENSARSSNEVDSTSRLFSETSSRNLNELQISIRLLNDTIAQNLNDLNASVKQLNEISTRKTIELNASNRLLNVNFQRYINAIKYSIKLLNSASQNNLNDTKEYARRHDKNS